MKPPECSSHGCKMIPGFHDEEGVGLTMRYICPMFGCDCWVSPGPTDVEDWCQHFLEAMSYGEDMTYGEEE